MININIEVLWYQKRVVLWPLIPLSILFSGIVKLRKKLYERGLLTTERFEAPVIVVGNLTVGGTGKTPLVIHIAHLLKKNGFKIGIVSRGYQGSHRAPTIVNQDSDPAIVGDEALLLAKQLDCPIVVGRNRRMAVRTLLQSSSVDVVVSDDGLQHYALSRQIEIVVIDGYRRFGNRYCLPAGPLREPESRLESVDLIVTHGGESKEGEYTMRYVAGALYNPRLSQTRLLEAFRAKTVHAVAGIGNPAQFFQLLIDHGLEVIPHPYPDHHVFRQPEIHFQDECPVILTEKDAVKCTGFFSDRHWVLPVTAQISPRFDTQLLTLLKLKGVNRG